MAYKYPWRLQFVHTVILPSTTLGRIGYKFATSLRWRFRQEHKGFVPECPPLVATSSGPVVPVLRHHVQTVVCQVKKKVYSSCPTKQGCRKNGSREMANKTTQPRAATAASRTVTSPSTGAKSKTAGAGALSQVEPKLKSRIQLRRRQPAARYVTVERLRHRRLPPQAHYRKRRQNVGDGRHRRGVDPLKNPNPPPTYTYYTCPIAEQLGTTLRQSCGRQRQRGEPTSVECGRGTSTAYTGATRPDSAVRVCISGRPTFDIELAIHRIGSVDPFSLGSRSSYLLLWPS